MSTRRTTGGYRGDYEVRSADDVVRTSQLGTDLFAVAEPRDNEQQHEETPNFQDTRASDAEKRRKRTSRQSTASRQSARIAKSAFATSQTVATTTTETAAPTPTTSTIWRTEQTTAFDDEEIEDAGPVVASEIAVASILPPAPEPLTFDEKTSAPFLPTVASHSTTSTAPPASVTVATETHAAATLIGATSSATAAPPPPPITVTPTIAPKVSTVKPFVAPTTVAPGAKEKNGVVTWKERARDFDNDPPEEIADAFTPPYAPKLKKAQADKLITWLRLEIYDEEHLRSQDWYRLLLDVKGASQRPFEEFAEIFGPETVSGVGSARSLSRVNTSAQETTGGSLRQYNLDNLMSVDDSDQRRPRGQNRAPVTSSVFGDAGGSNGQDDDSNTLGGDRQGNGGGGGSAPPPPPPASGVSGDVGAIVAALRRDAVANNETTVMSGARYREIRSHLDVLHSEAMLNPNAEAQAAARRVAFRKLIASSLPIYARYKTTGRLFINPDFLSAKAFALAKLFHYCGEQSSLTDIDEIEFTRSRLPPRLLPDGTVDRTSNRVRTLFVNLVAYIFLSKRAASKKTIGDRVSDNANYLAEINELLRNLKNRYGFDDRPGYRVFYDVGIRNDESRLPYYARASETMQVPYQSVISRGLAGGATAYSYAEADSKRARLMTTAVMK